MFERCDLESACVFVLYSHAQRIRKIGDLFKVRGVGIEGEIPGIGIRICIRV